MLWQAGRQAGRPPPRVGGARGHLVFCRDVCAPRRVTAVHFLQGYSICVFEYIFWVLKGTHTSTSAGARERVLESGYTALQGVGQ